MSPPVSPPRKKRRLNAAEGPVDPAHASASTQPLINGDIEASPAPAALYECPRCPKTFKKEEAFRRHEQRHEDADAGITSPTAPCPYCRKPLPLRSDGTLGHPAKHFARRSCRRARRRIEYEHINGPLEAGQQLPAAPKSGTASRKRRKPVGAYAAELNDHMVAARQRLTGEGESPDWPVPKEPRKRGHRPARTDFPPFHRRWNEEENHRFFYALERHSRLRPDLIAECVETRTVAEVDAYLALLASHAVAHPPPTRADLPIATEISDAWLRFEQRQATRSGIRLEIKDQQRVVKKREDAKEKARDDGASAADLNRLEAMDSKHELLADLSWRHLVSLGRDHSKPYARTRKARKAVETEQATSTEEENEHDLDHGIFSTSESEAALKNESGSDGSSDDGRRERRPKARVRPSRAPKSDWKDIDFDGYDCDDEDDALRLARDQLTAAAIDRVDFESAQLLDVHAVGTLLQSFAMIYDDTRLIMEGRISLAALAMLADLVKHHVLNLIHRISRLAELGHAGSPPPKALTQIVQSVVRSALHEGPIDGRNRLLTLLDAVDRRRGDMLAPPPAHTLHFGRSCPDCGGWLPSKTAIISNELLEKHQANKGCPGNPFFGLPPPVPLYTSTVPHGVAVASTSVVPGPTPLPPGALALPHIFDPAELHDSYIVPAYHDEDGRDRVDRTKTWEEREQDERWEEIHLDYSDRIRAREVERALWRNMADGKIPSDAEMESEVSEMEEWEVVEVKPRKRKTEEPRHGISKEVIDSDDEEL